MYSQGNQKLRRVGRGRGVTTGNFIHSNLEIFGVLARWVLEKGKKKKKKKKKKSSLSCKLPSGRVEGERKEGKRTTFQ